MSNAKMYFDGVLRNVILELIVGFFACWLICVTFYIHFDMPKYQNGYTKVTQMRQYAKKPTINSKSTL